MKLENYQPGGRVLLALGILWGIIVVFGLLMLFKYQSTPASSGNATQQWPGSSRIVLAGSRFQLVMAAHPHCPCTRASVESLARIMAHSQKRSTGTVLFIVPKGVARDWEKSDLWRTAAAIPGVRAVRDDEGTECARFGMESSGHVLLFNENGQRSFSGGITAGRGHHGDNAGLDRCLALINAEEIDHGNTPVFGCALHDRSAGQVEGRNLCYQSN